ncbi:hypothetical protein ISS37_10000 [candidate division KSB1 bacterium]|nr:hypothetical protein [candidate division KSB1 bacterium]
MDHHNVTFGRFKKSIKKSKGDELRNLFILLNNLQLYRNFSDVRSILTDFDSEKPEIWLGSLLCDSQKQEILIDELQSKSNYKEFVSSLTEIKSNIKLLSKFCDLPANLRQKAIFVIAHEHGLRQLTEQLEGLEVNNLHLFQKKLRANVGDSLQFEDLFFEGKFAVGLMRQIEGIRKLTFYPTVKTKGPDYQLDFENEYIYIEFTRLRTDEELYNDLFFKQNRTVLSEIPYGFKEIWTKLKTKTEQLIEGETNVVVLYSTHDARSDSDFQHVVNNCLEDETNHQLLENLSAILFAEKWSAEPIFWVNRQAYKTLPFELIEPFKKAIVDFKMVAL